MKLRISKPFNQIKLSVFLLAVSLFSPIVKADYLAQLQQQARDLKLSEQPHWLKLLHYSQQLFPPQFNSLITTESFFLHPEGKHSPELELQATLKGFFSDKGDNSAQCLFPARFLWLKQQLKIKTKHLPQAKCNKLSQWLNKQAVSSISLIFPVAYLNNPPSMFGHSFLRLDSKEQESKLLATTVNFAAVTDGEKGVVFAAKGLFGGYSGKFALAPYYELLKQYGDIESRDLWEYELNFNSQEVQALLLHLWELLAVEFDYYFINKNCSFQLLALIETARPSLNLTQDFIGDAIPADTVRAVTRIPNLLKKKRYRPALASVLAAKANYLNRAEQQLASEIAQQVLSIDSERLKVLDEKRQARVLDLAFDYLSYLNADKIKHKQAINGELAYQILAARSLLPHLEEVKVDKPVFSPDEGHAGNRVNIAYGYDGLADYLELGFRWSYHDLYDSSAGFVNGAQVEFFKPSVRYYPFENRLSFEGLELINIHSMSAANSFIQPFSWQVKISTQRQRFANQQREFVGGATIGGGLSYQTESGSLFSLSALSSLQFAKSFHQYTSVGIGTAFTFQHNINSLWRIGIEAELMQYFLGIQHTSYRYSLKQSFSLNQNHALVLELSRATEFSNPELMGQLAWRVYF